MTGGVGGRRGRIFSRGPAKKVNACSTTATPRPGLECRDEAGDAVEFFRKLCCAIQRCKQLVSQFVIIGILGTRDPKKAFLCDLFQSDFARVRQRMR